MDIIIGSMNRAKVNAVETVFTDGQIIQMKVSSDVSAQPLTSKETREGAINRAKHCSQQTPNAICIGLEGGVTMIDDTLYLCSWGALVVNNKIYTAGGPNIPLPNTFVEPLYNGVELAKLMESYTNLKDVRHREGAIGIFTNGQISRSELFAHIVQLLKGQMEYSVKG